jgi:hypothetical protein
MIIGNHDTNYKIAKITQDIYMIPDSHFFNNLNVLSRIIKSAAKK